MTHKIKLATVCQQIRGVSYTPKDMAEIPTEGYIPILRANNIQEKLVFNELVYVNANKISEIQLLKGGDIVVCASSGSKNLVGKAARFVSSPVDQVSFGAFCKVVRPRNIDASYLSHFFNSSYYRNTISKIAQGASINNIRNEHLDNLDINVPTPSEQKRIAKRLDKVQELIAKQKEQIAKLDLLIKSRFLDMFGDPISNPKKWPSRRMGDIFKITSGGTPSTQEDSYWLNGTISWIGSNLCQNIILNKNDGRFITEKGLNNSSAKILPVGTVLIALVGATIGKTALLNFSTTTNQNVAAIWVSKEESYDSLFVFYFIQGLYDLFMRLGSGKFKMANLQFINNLPIFNVPLVLQSQFANFVKSVEQQKEVFSARLSHLEVLYKSLMQEYFG